MKRAIYCFLFLLVLVTSARAEVLVRWREGALPSRDLLGVTTVVVPAGSALARQAADMGYRVVIDGDSSLKIDRSGQWPSIRSNFRMRGSQPVQVASRTAQPWIENNVALIRILQTSGRRPALAYSWKPASPTNPQVSPTADDYSLAIAEAGAFGADLVIDLDEKSMTAWSDARRYQDYYVRKRAGIPIANVGVLTNDPAPWYEVLNLLARHNVPYRILIPPGPHPMGELDLVIATEATKVNGIAPERVLHPGDDASDPNAFALKVRNVLGRKERLVDIWNGITVMVGLERGEDSGLRLELVNYDKRPLAIQVRVKGVFRRVEHTRPEAGPQVLVVEHINGFTEFVIPSLRIGGSVSLRP